MNDVDMYRIPRKLRPFANRLLDEAKWVTELVEPEPSKYEIRDIVVDVSILVNQHGWTGMFAESIPPRFIQLRSTDGLETLEIIRTEHTKLNAALQKTKGKWKKIKLELFQDQYTRKILHKNESNDKPPYPRCAHCGSSQTRIIAPNNYHCDYCDKAFTADQAPKHKGALK